MTIFVPDNDVDLNQWRSKHADHFASNQHVSESKFAQYFGSNDLGCRLHIPPAGPERDKMNEKIRRNEASARASKFTAG